MTGVIWFGWMAAEGWLAAEPRLRPSLAFSLLAFMLAAWLLPPVAALAQSRPGFVIPVSGERFSARLTAIDKDGVFTFEAAGKRRTLAPADFVSFGTFSDGEKGPLVVLADGGTLVAGSLDQVTSQSLSITTDLWGKVRLPLGQVRGIVFRPPAEALARDKLLERVLTAEGDEDQLLLDNGDLVTGQIKSAPAVQGPEPPEADAESLRSVRLETKAGPASLSIEKLTALMFNPALVETPRARGAATWLGFKDGSRLALARLASEGEQIKATLVSGTALSASVEELIGELVCVQPLGANVTYLSDLKPAGYKHIPFLELAWNYGLDKNVLGGRLRSGGAVYAKGISLHSTARLAYRLDGRFDRFAADLALDDAAGTRGSVIYRVFLERDAGDWQAAYESPTLRGGDPAIPISLDIRGAQRLALIVDYADRGDVLDRANWLNARLVK
jgi:hypothetical protein